MLTVPSAWWPALHAVWPAVPSLMQPLSSIGSLGETTPVDSAASAVIGLNVEPVGYAPVIERLKSGAPNLSLYSRSVCDSDSGRERIDGLNVGYEPSPSTLPSRGSSATKPPAVPGPWSMTWRR